MFEGEHGLIPGCFYRVRPDLTYRECGAARLVGLRGKVFCATSSQTLDKEAAGWFWNPDWLIKLTEEEDGAQTQPITGEQLSLSFEEEGSTAWWKDQLSPPDPLEQDDEDEPYPPEEVVEQLNEDDYYASHKDQGKLRYGLIPSLALAEVVKVMEHGARTKYEDFDYLNIQDGDHRLCESIWRHAEDVKYQWQMVGDVEALDKHSGLLSLAHIAADALMAIDRIQRAREAVFSTEFPMAAQGGSDA